MIYFDFAATTPCREEVLSKMLPYFSEYYGNASSSHILGRNAKQAIDKARQQIASLIDAEKKEVIFTSGATESNNLVFLSLLLSGPTAQKNRIVISKIEHKSILLPARLLAKYGFDVVEIPVLSNGIIDLEYAKNCINENTILVSCQLVNNELGTIQPCNEIAEYSHLMGAWFHCDTTQALGKLAFNFGDSPYDSISFSSHKIYGPKGIGALILSGGVNNFPWQFPLNGGNQEGGLRPGTHNIPGIVGFGYACYLLSEEWPALLNHYKNLYEYLILQLENNGCKILFTQNTIPNVVSVKLPYDASFLTLNRHNLCVSTGSACISGSIDISYVIKELNMDSGENVVRISLGRNTTQSDIDKLITIIIDTHKNANV